MLRDGGERVPNKLSQEQQNEQQELLFQPPVMLVHDGDTLQLDAQFITKNINGKEHIMYGYNGIIPGPTIIATRGSTIQVNVTNKLKEPTTVHWHGLRHNYKDDGVPHISQEPIQPEERFLYTLSFPDEGLFWYHPHIREDRQQDLGLYGNIIVQNDVVQDGNKQDTGEKDNGKQENNREREDNKNDRVKRQEFTLAVDDILLDEDNAIVPFGEEHANFALMGRFGNVLLLNGQVTPRLLLVRGETARFFLTIVSNARPFNVSIVDAQRGVVVPLKIVGYDLGRPTRETIVESVVLGPAERIVVEAFFPTAGTYIFKNKNLWLEYDLATIIVEESTVTTMTPTTASNIPLTMTSFLQPQEHPDVINDIEQYRKYFDKPVDKEIVLGIELETHGMSGMMEMHSVTDVEWEDTMQEMNAQFDGGDITWFIEDKATKKRNDDLQYIFQKGDVKKIRITNTRTSEHPMQHLIHLHGQRFLVITQDGVSTADVQNTPLAWKDTVFVPTGSTVDILVDMSNSGVWMMHCHIAEHLETGMMASFIVE